ncbi:MAG: NYN domain-containing protein [Actinobacteria bacterium]|nr:NYN domain-containing protein [Actinomycetota bacterium]
MYVDAFNLYYGSLKDSPYRWLDLGSLCRSLLPGHAIGQIRYFTAIVQSRPGDPSQQQRQQVYLRALRTIPGLTIHLGSFLTNAVRLPLADPGHGSPRTVEVLRTEEKGSDVNLATRLLVDGFHGAYGTAVVISNDSDLKAPIEAARRELGLRVGVVIPNTRVRRSALPADFYRRIRGGALAASQFPQTVNDADGSIHRPRSW